MVNVKPVEATQAVVQAGATTVVSVVGLGIMGLQDVFFQLKIAFAA